jgi:hypothetical protein
MLYIPFGKFRAMVGFLKRSEAINAYDRGTRFTPFSLKW